MSVINKFYFNFKKILYYNIKMDNQMLIILVILLLFFMKNNKEHLGVVGHWISHTASSAYHGVAHAATDTAKFIGDNTIKGMCYMPGMKQMSHAMLNRVAENRWNNRFKILSCNDTDKMKRDAGNAATWMFGGKAGKAGKSAETVYKQKVHQCNILKGNCKRGPRQGPYPNNNSAQLVHQNYTCNWNEGTKRCNCCSNGNCKNVNNYMLGYEVIRPPSEHARMC